MFTWMWIFEIVLLATLAGSGRAQTPGLHTPTTCEEFEYGARFNPYEVVDAMWKIFYFWANTTEVYPIIFSLPAEKRVARFREVVDAVAPELRPEWQKASLIMEPRPGTQVLLLYAGTPGAFRAIVKVEQRNKARPNPEPLIKLADVRFKVVGRYMGMMCCEDLTGYALARMDELPVTERDCEFAARTLGFKGENGRSYLYVKKRLSDEL